MPDYRFFLLKEISCLGPLFSARIHAEPEIEYLWVGKLEKKRLGEVFGFAFLSKISTSTTMGNKVATIGKGWFWRLSDVVNQMNAVLARQNISVEFYDFSLFFFL